MALTADAFTTQAAVASLRERLVALRSKQFSDLVDDEGHQYIDLVLEGGGVLGIALLGYIYALEQVGLRFLGIGGASAGAITATFLAAAGKPEEEKSSPLIEMVADMPMASFVDGDGDCRRLIDAALQGKGKLTLAWRLWRALDDIKKNLALNPGRTFERWAAGQLEKVGVSTLARLRDGMARIPLSLRHRETGDRPDAPRGDENLCIIAADISTETRVEFPRMARLYWSDPASVHPATFIRASMAVPGFFSPLKVARQIEDSESHRKNWQDLAGFNQEDTTHRKKPGDWMPREYHFVDGGVMSNFPIDAFHKPDRVPRCPTFGVKLQWDERNHAIANLKVLGLQIFNSARHVLDYEFIKRHPDYRQLVAFIDTADHNWLDFAIRDEAKLDLFARGARTAVEFLGDFDWARYKTYRAKLASSYAQ